MEWLKPLLRATGLIKFFFWLNDRFLPNNTSAQENESVAVARRFVELF